MKKAIDSFDESIQRTIELGGLYTAIRNLTTPVVDATDILRSQIVFAVSALDNLIHEITVYGILEIYDGARPTTDAYDKFHIPLSGLTYSAKYVLDRNTLEAIVREKHGYLAFQRPDKIADAIRLFSPVALWNEVSKVIGEDTKRVKERLNLVVDRRNKIAHEADADPSYPGARWPISESLVCDVLKLVEGVGHAVCAVCKAT